MPAAHWTKKRTKHRTKHCYCAPSLTYDWQLSCVGKVVYEPWNHYHKDYHYPLLAGKSLILGWLDPFVNVLHVHMNEDVFVSRILWVTCVWLLAGFPLDAVAVVGEPAVVAVVGVRVAVRLLEAVGALLALLRGAGVAQLHVWTSPGEGLIRLAVHLVHLPLSLSLIPCQIETEPQISVNDRTTRRDHWVGEHSKEQISVNDRVIMLYQLSWLSCRADIFIMLRGWTQWTQYSLAV